MAVNDVTDISDRLYRKVALRLLPILGLGYLIAYIDRVNVGFAKLEMSADIGLSSAAYGLGAGIFFIAYCLLELPSTLALEKVGARIWLSRIMVTWGIVVILTGFVQNPTQFYIARVALGAAEAGFFPGVMFYLALWFPRARLGRATAVIVLAGSLAGVVVGPMSGYVMSWFDSAADLAGWRWLFIFVGIPAVMVGVVMYFLLPKSVDAAPWLDDAERRELRGGLAEDTGAKEDRSFAVIARVLACRKVWVLGFGMAAIYLTVYAVAFWMPTMIDSAGVSDVRAIGWIAAIPGVAAAVASIVFGKLSDRTGRCLDIAMGTMVGAAIGLVLSVSMGSAFTPTVVGLALANGMAFASVPAIWVLVHREVGHGAAAAAGIALVNTVASCGSFFGPYLLGLGEDITGSVRLPVIFIALVTVAAAAALRLEFGRGERRLRTSGAVSTPVSPLESEGGRL